MKEGFYKELEILYKLIEEDQKELQRFYDILKNRTSILDDEIVELEYTVDDFLNMLGLDIDGESRLAAINRIVNLREDLLVQLFKQKGFDEEEVIEAKEKAYLWVADFYISRFEKILKKIEDEKLLTPFYREIIKGAHETGLAFSSWQSSWVAQIINGTNRELYRLFNGDEEKIFEMLNEKRLLDPGPEGCEGDRCYSVLRICDKGFERVSYAKAFEEEVKEVVKRVEKFIKRLHNYDDEVFNLKNEWIDYLSAIVTALKEEDPDLLISRWADVDRCWMKITSPVQIGHPLEYYEDRYRKAVALEWDIRVANPKFTVNERVNRIKYMFDKIFNEVAGAKQIDIYNNTLENLNRVQLYIGRPLFFYGAEFNGLFSAQVVPNDETVSKEYGKKIFAYADMILQTQKAKPPMKITKEVFGDNLAKKFREVFEKPDIWYKIYEITTIGHEYGHILWMDEDSETVMNKTGQFKNMEEFKATLGGLVSFFLAEEDDLWRYVLEDTVKRAVGLIAWMETSEVEPYYVEGLLHLTGLFSSGVLKFDKKLQTNLSKSGYEKLKEWYLKIYKKMAGEFYLPKRDAKEFLSMFVSKENGIYLPLDRQVREFTLYYWDLYKKIGRVVDK
ncbi:invasion protein CiaB [Nitrosophilus alvini]|uniref:invasion protein CiaB n=1 Tax=Nitrosophilus alvini TaxID=2714855 RepID=UPI0019092CA7|nr:invasion protein CiaB [Nitrosophilus alvini]